MAVISAFSAAYGHPLYCCASGQLIEGVLFMPRLSADMKRLLAAEKAINRRIRETKRELRELRCRREYGPTIAELASDAEPEPKQQ